MAAARAAQEALFLRHLLRDLGYEQMAPTVIFEDNQACIAIDQVEKGNVELQYMKTADMTADIMTKALPRDAHLRHTRTLMGMRE
eukprot:3861192-Rhodomonas_salina.5